MKITLTVLACCAAVFLCVSATAFGDDGRPMSPEYTSFGWTVRVAGGVLGRLRWC